MERSFLPPNLVAALKECSKAAVSQQDSQSFVKGWHQDDLALRQHMRRRIADFVLEVS
jgi:hypothetical protein